MQADINAFLTAMNKPQPAFDYELSEALEEWRNNGAIAKNLHEVVAEVKRRAGKGKVTQPGGKGTKGGHARGKGFGEFKRGLKPQGGKGLRSIRGKITTPAPTPRPVSRSSSYGQASSYGRGSSSSGNFQWQPTISSSTSSARRAQESTSPGRGWQ